jgi:hypothetical protein
MTLGIGIASSSAGENWFDFVNGGESLGLVRDGQWHEVVIPLNRFGNIDYRTIKQAFMLRGVGQPGAFTIGIDNVYWAPSAPSPSPADGAFGIFTENPAHMTAGSAVLGVDDQFYIWGNTLTPVTVHPYEGTGSMAFQSTPGQTWFGAAFSATVKYNLSAFRYANSKLHLALKTNATQTFNIGMKSGNVDLIGQKWIKFQNGSDPYGFVRDGQWHVVEIPMSDFGGVDLKEVSQLFEIFAENSISFIEFDDVCFINGGAPLMPGVAGDVNLDGTVNFADYGRFSACIAGPGQPKPAEVSQADFDVADTDDDGDSDLKDFAKFQSAFVP